MAKILALLTEIRPEQDYTSSDNFVEDGLLDSFDIVTLVASLDKTYGISIDGVDVIPENFKNSQTIEALLRKHGVEP